MLIEIILELRQQRLSLREISRRMGIPYSTLRDNLSKLLGPEGYKRLIYNSAPSSKGSESKGTASIAPTPYDSLDYILIILSELTREKLYSGQLRLGRFFLRGTKHLTQCRGNLLALNYMEKLEAEFPLTQSQNR